jgi:hypothetical protein
MRPGYDQTRISHKLSSRCEGHGERSTLCSRRYRYLTQARQPATRQWWQVCSEELRRNRQTKPKWHSWRHGLATFGTSCIGAIHEMAIFNVDSTVVCDKTLARAEAAGAAGPTDSSATT